MTPGGEGSGESSDPEATKKTTKGGSAVKRQVRMNSQVRAVYEDGDSTMENLAEDKFTAGAKKSDHKSKPVGQRVPVVDVATTAPVMECNPQ